MGTIHTVVTMGFGSFGSVNLLPTIGYNIGPEIAVAPLTGIELRVENYKVHLATVED
jgi:hypothetical protein